MNRLSSEKLTRVQNFLAPSLIVLVGTVGSTGVPQLTPNWYVYQDGKVKVSTTKERVKYKNVIRDPRLSLCVYSDISASEYLAIYGRAKIYEDATIWQVTQSIVERYMSPDLVEAKMRDLRTENRVIISVDIERVVFRE
jgi:hypothetical protein